MGQCYNGLEMPREAVRALSQVIAQAPDHAKAHHLLAICFDKLGERDRADEAYRKSDLFVTMARQRRGAARLGHA
jgi:Flp pilus assembly protein TadD